MITFQVTPTPSTDTEGVRFLFEFQPNGSEILVAKENTTDLTQAGLEVWAKSVAHPCGRFQADLITRESVERAFPGNPSFAISQYTQWISMPVGSTAPKNMGGAATFIIINDDVCSTVASSIPETTTTTAPPETTTTVPPGTTTTATSFQNITFSETVPTITPRTPTTLPSTGPTTEPLPFVGVAVILFALMLLAIAKRIQTR